MSPTPPFAPIPPANVRLSLGPEEWKACLEAWLMLSEVTLGLPISQFSLSASDHGTLPAFLRSYYRELASLETGDDTLSSPTAISLRKACFRIVSRILVGDAPIPQSLLGWDFLTDFCHTHVRSTALQLAMSRMWRKKGDVVTPRLQKQKDLIISLLESKNIESAFVPLTQLASLFYASPYISAFFMTGSDFLDSLLGAYDRTTTAQHKNVISTMAYLGLTSLVRIESSNPSLLSDHLYTLKSYGERSPPNSSLLADVVTNSPLLTRLRRTAGSKAPDRLFKLLDELEMHRTPSLARPRRKTLRRNVKANGKRPRRNSLVNVHHMSLVTQVQDLFPQLGSGFVLKLLSEYEDDVEQVTAHLLDESLPPHLAALDQSEQAPVQDNSQQVEVDLLVPRSTTPASVPYIPESRNVFDDDELDRLDFDTSRLHIGKRNQNIPTSDQPNKAAILSALATFDSDDDERDDTYDAEDVGGTIDTHAPDGEPGPTTIASTTAPDETDIALYAAYKSNAELFGRSFNVRRGQPRMALKRETGLTDEQIEGWAIMLQRDPKRATRLDRQVGVATATAFDGRQTELAPSAYRETPGNTDTEGSDGGGGGRGGFRGRGRGRSRGRTAGGDSGGGGRGGGNVAGPSSDPLTANAQRRKEAGKGSRANHNRRDQRLRKMARGGAFPG